MFQLFDDDNSGKISHRNLKRVAHELGETMTDAELLEMIDRADTDGDGYVVLLALFGDPLVAIALLGP